MDLLKHAGNTVQLDVVEPVHIVLITHLAWQLQSEPGLLGPWLDQSVLSQSAEACTTKRTQKQAQ